jgi:hypothetical protein
MHNNFNKRGRRKKKKKTKNEENKNQLLYKVDYNRVMKYPAFKVNMYLNMHKTSMNMYLNM